ncbi:hypothetical protein [Cellulophaga tyrosinoxydans]|uniref:Beta-lactamase-inhibitor-like, PepSY-like n=1 Tax=Cellulophaga tyrosinoxydans TaxID=504486 RepID=A0A1W1Z5S4_9FLAO|nr:hypothetical protein [Cellulophaga tyrosinoxydans]SMC43827.1 hypothetical protein SAMN05660703_1196 [Cellulophaga tyrosinoxydans]
MKFNFILPFLFFGVFTISAQVKYEREFRIKKSDFPSKAFELIESKLTNAKRIKYYKEIDSATTSFEAKFKKDRLWYSIEFSEDGNLEDIEITIKAIDLPNDSYENIQLYLTSNFSSYKIRKIQQQYVVENSVDATLKNAFQNLMIPSLNYELIVDGKKNKSYQEFEILFNAEGDFVSSRKSLPPNYDHVLY